MSNTLRFIWLFIGSILIGVGIYGAGVYAFGMAIIPWKE